MPPKIEQKPQEVPQAQSAVPNIIAPAVEPKAREGQAEEGPKRNTLGNYLPGSYKTPRGNIRTDK